ncbi:MAG: oligosaccharide flippase family protein [Candidatus Levybacteria bacterium]|nr:oligosaccharide flippase family protein [Candidatus Levybacteria bacterium]
MKKLMHKVVKNPFVSGSIIVFLGTFVGNIFNFLFNFFMTRNLSVSDYGILASLVSIILLFALASDSIIPTVIHFSGQYFARNEIKKVSAFFWKLNKLFIIFGIVTLGIFIIFGSNVSHFFKIENNFLIFLVGVIISVISLSSLNKGILAGRLSFGYISFFNFFSSILKFFAGMLFVFLGLGVNGGILAFLIAHLFAYLFTFFPLKSILRGKRENVIGIKEIFKYAAPSGIAMLGLTLFITTDIILVKHFFSGQEAGVYAGMSLLGRIIYFFSAPIATVLFPLVVQLHTRRERHSHFFYLSIVLVLISSIGITIFYYFFPEFSIKFLLKQEEYLVIKPTLWIFGIFMIIYSVLSIVTNYYLSIKKTKVFIPVLFGAICQAILVYLYHDTFQIVVIISIITTTIPLIILLFYYWRIRNDVIS